MRFAVSEISGATNWQRRRRGVGISTVLSLILVLVLLFPYRVEREWLFFSTLSVLEPTILGICITVIILTAFRGRLFLGNRGLFVILMLPVLFALLSLGWTVDTSATVKSIIVHGAALAVFWVTVFLFYDSSFYALARMILALPIVLVITALLSYIPGSPFSPELTFAWQTQISSNFLLSYWARFSHPFLGLSNSFATVLAILLPLVLVIGRIGIHRRLARVIAVVSFAAVVATGSRGVLLAVIFSFGLSFVSKLIRTWRIPRGILLAFLGTFFLVAGFFLISPIAQQHLADRLTVTGIVSRVNAFSVIVNAANDFPFGVGSGVPVSAVTNIPWETVHNAYLQNLLWFGWAGGIILSAAMWCLLPVIYSSPARAKETRVIRQGFAISILILLLINLSHASWEGSIIRIWVYFVFGIGQVLLNKAESIYG